MKRNHYEMRFMTFDDTRRDDHGPRLDFVDCSHEGGRHRMAVWLWGDEQAAHTVVCVHGLTRQGRDFDVLARALLARASHPLRVVCPDVVGRGRSEWLSEPMAYGFPQYCQDMGALLLALQARAPMAALDWVGTSMGGVIGLMLAAAPPGALPVPVRRLVLNDVGPRIEWAALQRIGQYVGATPRFESVAAAAEALSRAQIGFGTHTEAEWLALSAPMVRPLAEGGYALHYDPRLAEPYHALTQEASQQGAAVLWHLYDQLRQPVLLLRGAESDLLSAATAQEMAQRGPQAEVLTFAGVGHAPTLVHEAQWAPVCDFLLAPATDDLLAPRG